MAGRTAGISILVYRGGTLVAHQRSGSIKVNGETIDITTKDSASWWREFLASWMDAEIQIAGELDVNGASQEEVFTTMVSERTSGTPTTMIFALNGSSTGSRFSGDFWTTGFENSGAHDGAAEFSNTFKLTGALSYTSV